MSKATDFKTELKKLMRKHNVIVRDRRYPTLDSEHLRQGLVFDGVEFTVELTELQ